MTMDDGRLAPAGLCATCTHARSVTSARGSVFLMCERSRTDARYPKYPRLPLLTSPPPPPRPLRAPPPRLRLPHVRTPTHRRALPEIPPPPRRHLRGIPGPGST